MNPIQMHPVIVLGMDHDGNLVCAIAELPDQPGEVGVMLADVIRHVANAYHGPDESKEKSETVMEIWEMLKAEMSSPTELPQMVTGSGYMRPSAFEMGEDE